jgi:hypothetical protein
LADCSSSVGINKEKRERKEKSIEKEKNTKIWTTFTELYFICKLQMGPIS